MLRRRTSITPALVSSLGWLPTGRVRSNRTRNNRLYSSSAEEKKPILITTPIYYVNGRPHIGHLYSTLLADALSRWFRMTGHQVRFSTGTDEHGIKVQETAEKQRVSVEDWCSDISSCFKALFQKANIQYDDYIRTTEPRHQKAVEKMWNILYDRDRIYEGKFEGWYSVSDEAFLTPHQVIDSVDPATGQPIKISSESGNRVTWLTEPNYMFKLSEYQQKILDWIDAEQPIHPSQRRDEIVADLKRGLRDLSVSRLRDKIQWGIPVPTDKNHVVYVWLDALTNYLTVAGFPDAKDWSKFWPADYHIVGKDIIKFHTIYWPAFLMAAGLPLPKRIIAHAHWTMNKEKMSKSKGNVVEPMKLLEDYGVDPVRYFLLRESFIAHDGDFSYEAVTARLIADLADNFGNLASRCAAPALNPVEGKWPEFIAPTEEQIKLSNEIDALPEQVDQLFRECEFGRGLSLIFDVIRSINRHFATEAPWTFIPKKPADRAALPADELQARLNRLSTTVYLALEAIRVTGLLLYPVMPGTMESLLQHLKIPQEHRNPLIHRFGYNYEKNIGVSPLGRAKPPILFVKPAAAAANDVAAAASAKK